MKTLRRNSLFSLILMMAASVYCYSQSTGSLVGTVHDSSGAVVPNVNVIATDVLTGIQNRTVTSQSGDYTFPGLSVGVYTINFSAGSFQTVDVEKVEIHVASTIRQDVTLAAAGVNTKIVVNTANAPLLQSENAEIGQLVESRQISELPLNERHAYALLALTAGTETAVAPSATTQYTDANRPSIGGGRAGATVFRVNGINVNNQNLPSASIEPSVDAIQEFRTITQLGSAAESGSSSVYLATKSGSNEFHGTAYEFFRNNVLDAQPYFHVTLPPTPGFKNIGDQLRFNQFGGSVGGPIWKDRTFFFGSVQATRQRTLTQLRQVFPTVAELGGDFSGIDPTTGVNFAPIFDPKTGAPFPGNKINSARFSSYAGKLIALGAVAPSNCDACLAGGLGFNAVGNAPGSTNDIQYIGRIDHRFRGSDSLFGSFLIEPTMFPSTESPLPISRTVFTNHGYEVAVGETHTFTPLLLNEFRLGYTRNFSGFAQTEDAKGAFPFQNASSGLPSIFPSISIQGYAQFGNGKVSNAASEIEDSIDLNDAVTWIHGKHEVQAGFEGIRARFKDVLNLNAALTYLNGFPSVLGFTSNAFSDFLLGTPFLGITVQGTGGSPGVKRNIYAGFVQDNWKVLPTLTLNLGLRYEVPKPWQDFDTGLNRLSTLDTSAASAAVKGRFLLAGSPNTYIPGTGVVTGTGAPLAAKSIVNPSYTDIQPRVGFAYRPFADNKTVIRGGFGIYYPIQDANRLAFELLSPPFKFISVFVNIVPTPTGFKPYLDSQLFPVAGAGAAGSEGDNPANRDPRTYQWTLSTEHQVSENLLFSLEYLGNHSIKLPVAFQRNQAPLPNTAQLAALEANPSGDNSAAQARSPFPNIPLNYQYVTNAGTASYQALNAKAEGRFGRRLNFTATYTWSKALDTASSETDIPGYTYNLAVNKGYSAYDHPQRFVASWVYELPFGDTVLHTDNKVLGAVIGGWETTGIASFEGGAPYSVITGGNADTSFRGGANAGITVYANQSGPLVHNDIRKSHGIYLTPQNFVVPPFGQLGTTRRNAFHGPGIDNFDLGLIKNIPIYERLRLQIRGEMFNAFNHGQFLLPSPQSLALAINGPTGSSTQPTVSYIPASQFGRVVPQPARVVQFGAKIIF